MKREAGDPALTVPRRLRPLVVVIYAAFIGVLLVSYLSPLHDIFAGRAEVPELEQRLQSAQDDLAAQQSEVDALETPAGIERAARERYGMIMPGERIYVVPKPDSEGAENGGE